jgi:sugar phosphate isomerase/epimerase
VPKDLSLQLYTVRRQLDQDLDGTIERIAGTGFRLVEPFNVVALADRLEPALREHGLSAPTTHAALLRDEPAPIFDAAQRLGITTVIVPHVDAARWQRAEDIEQIATELGEVARAAADRGLRVGYHNHHFELATKIDGRHALEVLTEHLAPEVTLEVDTYWAAAGGADVPALLRRLGSRVSALHVKDGDGSLDPMAQVAVGAGRIPVLDILAAAPDALRVVELDDFAGEMFDAVTESYEYLQGAP